MKVSLVIGSGIFLSTVLLAGTALAGNEEPSGSIFGGESPPVAGQKGGPPGLLSAPGQLSAPDQVSPPEELWPGGFVLPPIQLSPPDRLSAPGQISPPPTVTVEKLAIGIEVTDTGTGLPVDYGATLTSPTSFQVRISSPDKVCAGQFVVTAIGGAGQLPAVAQAVSFAIGPGNPSNVATGSPVDTGLKNDWKISATCNGAGPGELDTAFFEFWVLVP